MLDVPETTAQTQCYHRLLLGGDSQSMLVVAFGIVAAILYGYAGWRILRVGRALFLQIPIALTIQGTALSLQIFHHGSLRIGLAESVSLFAWQSALTLWVFNLRENLEMLGIALYPLVGLCALFGSLTTNKQGGLVPVNDWHIEVHIIISLLATGILTIACLQALALAFLEHLLHRQRNRLHLLRRLPPLQTMERLLFQTVFAGFFLLSLTLLSGLLFVHNLAAQHLIQKTALSFCAWFIFGVLLWGRRRYGWRGHTAIRWVLSGYVVLVLAYFGSKLFIEKVLGSHWS